MIHIKIILLLSLTAYVACGSCWSKAGKKNQGVDVDMTGDKYTINGKNVKENSVEFTNNGPIADGKLAPQYEAGNRSGNAETSIRRNKRLRKDQNAQKEKGDWVISENNIRNVNSENVNSRKVISRNVNSDRVNEDNDSDN